MPLIDMPLEELRRYQGRNPKPADFDSYWADALAELDAVNPNIQEEGSAFSCGFADCRDLWFTGVRGARQHAKMIAPRGKAKGAVVVFHGYSMSAGDWTDKLP
ncbi:MAG TPA: acetylxylan esterase, partial [Fimbriimonadaceae bacterium]|nr:acetylxylan esterase [Fimbriimonadaceae bacterium]